MTRDKLYQNFFTAAHLMVDLESTGLDAQRDSIVEIGARFFNPFKPNLDNICFEQQMKTIAVRNQLNTGYWTETTERQQRLTQFKNAELNPKVVFTAFNDWIQNALINSTSVDIPTTTNMEVYLWAKPGHFEWGFLSSYYAELGLTNPFKYNRVIDLRSYCYGLFGPNGIADRPDVVKKLDDILDSRSFKHRGLADVDSQIEMLAKACALFSEYFSDPYE